MKCMKCGKEMSSDPGRKGDKYICFDCATPAPAPSTQQLEMYKRANESLRRVSAKLEREVWGLRAQNARLDAENRELREQLGRLTVNSKEQTKDMQLRR